MLVLMSVLIIIDIRYIIDIIISAILKNIVEIEKTIRRVVLSPWYVNCNLTSTELTNNVVNTINQ